MRTKEEIKRSLIQKTEEKFNDTVAEGTVLDFLINSLSEEMEGVYQEIENNKNPHIWSKLQGKELDDTGTMVNLSRKTNQDDSTFKYRLMNWTLSNEAGNETSISDELLTPTYASNIEFKPCTKGSGTATCYVIPKDYSDESIQKALQEAHEKVKTKVSPTTWVEYIIPTIKGIKMQIYIAVTEGTDIKIVKQNIDRKISEYVNSVAPNDYVDIGAINKLGINTDNVEYFNVLSVLVDDVVKNERKLLQDYETKYIYDQTTWVED